MNVSTEILPPVLIGIGTLIPFAIKANPFEVPERLSMLLGLIFALGSWIAYFFAISYAHAWKFSPAVMIPTAALSLALFIVALLIANGQQPETNGNKRAYRLGVGIFLAAIILLTVAAGTWVSQSDKVIITITQPDGFEQVSLYLGDSDTQSMRIAEQEQESKKETIVLPAEVFDRAKKIEVGSVKLSIGSLLPVPTNLPSKRFKLEL